MRVRVHSYTRRKPIPSGHLRAEPPEGSHWTPGTRDVYIGKDLVGHYRIEYTLDRKSADIRWVVVRGDIRGKGIGRRIVEKILRDLRDDGVETVCVVPRAEAHGFWEKMGFKADEYCFGTNMLMKRLD